MAFYYVKSGFGTRTTGGGFATPQTGSFTALGATNVYESLIEVYADTTPPIEGDTVYLSDIHTKVHAGGVSIGDGPRVLCVSVSDTAIDQYSAGASESTQTGNNDFRVDGALTFIGVDLLAGDDFLLGGDSSVTLQNGKIEFDSSGDVVNALSFDNALFLSNTDIVWPAGTTGAVFLLSRGVRYAMVGGAIRATTGTVDDLVTTNSTGGGTVKLIDVDLSSLAGIANGVGASLTDLFDVTLINCQLSPSVTFSDEEFVGELQELLIVGCGSDASAEYQYFYKSLGGEVEDENSTGIHRNESVAYRRTSEKVSYKVTTTATASLSKYFTFKIRPRYVELSNVASNVVRVHFVSTTTLTDTDVWIDMMYPDGTNTFERNMVSTRATDLISSGTEHAADTTSDWRNGGSALTGYNEYYIDIDTSSNPGADGVPDLFIYVAIPSAIIYFDTSVGVN